MKFRLESVLLATAMAALCLVTQAGANTAITYQGQLAEDGGEFTGIVDMEFQLFDEETGGNEIGGLIEQSVSVEGGLFRVELDFGDANYGLGRFLQITVDGDELNPRQQVTAAPLAVRTLVGESKWSVVSPDVIAYQAGPVIVGGIPPDATGSQIISTLSVVQNSGAHTPFGVFNQSQENLFMVTNNGAVNIGTSTPQGNLPERGLRVEGRTRMEGNLGIHLPSSGDASFPLEVYLPDGISGFAAALSSSGSTAFFAGPPGSQSAFFIGDPVVLGSNTEFRMSSDATIGGTLQAGMVQVETLSTATDIELCRSPLAGGGAFLAFCSSSIRYKEEVTDMVDVENVIEGLRTVSFRWKESGEESIGLIAEEVAELDSRLVTRNQDGKIEGIKYRSLTALLVKALQVHNADMSAELAVRDAKIASLQAELDAQRNETAGRLAALEVLLLEGPEVAEARK